MKWFGWLAGTVLAVVIVLEFHITAPATYALGFALSALGFMLGMAAERGKS